MKVETTVVIIDDAAANAGDGKGQTIAAVVREALGGIAWSKAREMVRRGKVTVDGETAEDPAVRVKAGQELRITPEGLRRRRGVLEREAIVHLDADVVVVNKAPGLLSVPYAAGDKDTLVDQTFAALKRKRPPQRSPLGVVQRLDKDTTGLMVFPRNLAAKRALARQLRDHSVTRSYVAIVHGEAQSQRHESTFIQQRGDGLRGSWGVYRRPKTKVPPSDAKRAVSHVRVLRRLEGATLIECRLETGRQHQIRIHLSEAGNPLVGERVYIREWEGEQLEAPRIMLHAQTLGFDHPRTGERVEFSLPGPEDFQGVLERLKG
ncbi:MAG: RluA family pseudouridine synthase [Deltaproteobacteria bacterium]|nr:MAG: RluA family pseudouridine synthase [Deltaproteobacteria bacterium]